MYATTNVCLWANALVHLYAKQQVCECHMTQPADPVVVTVCRAGAVVQCECHMTDYVCAVVQCE